MIRRQFVHRVEGLRDDLLQLGDSVAQSLERSLNSLRNQNTATAQWVIENDARIDEHRRRLEERVVMFFATQQPVVAHDLRLVASVGAIATELERIGDYASHIAASVFQQSDTMAEMAWSADIEQMTVLVQRMVRESLEAFLNQDVEQARHLGTLDEEVDTLRDKLQFDLVQRAQGNIHYLNSILAMLNVVHVMERAADRATNIGERVIYIMSSNMEEINA